jgi:hypothetical protein
LDVIGTKVLRVFLLFIVTSTNGFYFPLPLEQKWFEMVCDIKFVYRNLKSEISQDHAPKPQGNCTFMNSASGGVGLIVFPFYVLVVKVTQRDGHVTL